MTPSLNTASGDALRLIGPGAVSRGGSLQPQRASAGGPPGSEFADLLARAASGELISGMPVKVDRSAAVTLSDEQLARLSVAADRAEAEGMTRALMLLDGVPLLVDVKNRTVLGQVDLNSATLTGIDGVLAVPGSTPRDQPLPLPGTGQPANPSLLEVLSRPPHKSKSA